ncbi:MAG TPA: RNA 2',3'-cyclic phosphodiesterase [Candidatus Kryptonia bacterium]
MRIFFGATIPDQIKSKIGELQNELFAFEPGARLESKSKLHITLQFIGEFGKDGLEELFASARNDLNKSSVGFSPVRLAGMNYFPNEKMKRGIWIDCSDDGSLSKIARTIELSSAKYGVTPEQRGYKPHITLARLKEYRGRKESSIDLQKFWSESKLGVERFVPRSVALFESFMNPDRSGSEYRILHEFPLQESEGASADLDGQKGSSKNG